MCKEQKLPRYDRERIVTEQGTQYNIVDRRHAHTTVATTDSAYFAERIVKLLNAEG